MGWLISALLALLLASILALVAPAVFGPAVAGIAPLLVVVAVIGLGGIWWRHSRSRIDAEAPGADEEPDTNPKAVDDRVET